MDWIGLFTHFIKCCFRGLRSIPMVAPLCLPGYPAQADQASALGLQRLEFKAAQRALTEGRTAQFHRAKQGLVDYPLYPYLEYWELRSNLSHAKADTVRRFLARYKDVPISTRLRSAWLKRLADGGRWAEFARFYTTPASTTKHCQYLRSLLSTGRRAQALDQVRALWLVGKSQPKACDPVFAAWRKAGRLSADLVWQRIHLAMDAGRPGLARYLTRYLGPTETSWVEIWRQVHKKPSLVLAHSRLARKHPVRNYIVLYGVARMARRDSAAALDAWRELQARYRFSLAETARAESAIALAMARQGHPKALRYLAALPHNAAHQTIREQRILLALGREDWTDALTWLNALPQEERKSEQWLYWRARAEQQSGDAVAAGKLYAELAVHRSYYGFLAADRLGIAYSFNHGPLSVSEMELAELEDLPGIVRARELLALGRLVDARREWRHITTAMTETDLLGAAKLAHTWGWHDQVIFTLGRTRHRDDLIARFPLAFRAPVERHAQYQQIEPAWVFAVMRQESAFIADARSRAGALGLMQIMPATAEQVARSLKIPYRGTATILTADTNIRLGTAYLRKMLNRLHNHPVLATAAYNAGPHRVLKWLPKQDAMPADLWIEKVPFRETRKYLRRVLAYTIIYQQRLGLEPTSLHQRLRPILAPEKVGSVDQAYP